MGINQFQAPASPLDAISKALNVASTIYGIKHAGAANDLVNQQLAESQQKTSQEKTTFGQQQDEYTKEHDPASDRSVKAQAVGGGIYDTLVQSKAIDPTSKAAIPLHDALTHGSSADITEAINKYGLGDIVKEGLANQRNEALMSKLALGLGHRDSNQAQSTFDKDKVVNTYVPRLDGAVKIMGLMDSAEKGDFKSNQAMLGQLNAEISKLETGSNSPALGATERTEMQDAAAKWHNVLDTLSGNVTGVDLSQKFAQARGMVKDLAKSYMNQIEDRGNFLKAGSQPDQQQIYDAKLNSLKSQYGKRMPSLFQESPAPAAPGAAPPQPEEMIPVISPEGKPGKIPKSSLGTALKRGFKQNAT